MIIDEHGRAHYPAGTPRSKGGEFAPTGASWVTRMSARMRPGEIVPGRSTPRGRPALARPGRPRNAQRGLPPVREGVAQGVWGSSHSQSFWMAGESATLMGITGYRTFDDGDRPFMQAAATRFLRTIYEGSQPSDVRRFHGTAGRQWADVRPGQTVDLPLTATARDRGTVTYGMDRSGERDGPDAPPPYLIVFPKGTASAGISHEWDDNGDYRLPTWDEAVVAGRFRVKARHDVRTPGIGYYTRIELEPVEVFDPVRRRWVPPRRRRRPGHDFGEHQQLVDELRDGGARVHPDHTVSVWPIEDLGGEGEVQYSTSRRRAMQQAEWRGRQAPEEVRLPLDEARMLYQYSDETRLAVPEPASAGGPAPQTNWPAQLADQLRAEFPGLMLDLHRDPSGYVVLPRIRVTDQRQGIGTAVMQRIIEAADANGDALALTPTAEWGSSLPRLIRFYRRFGFVPNKGRAKDFATRETMIRRPR